jgi:hypothetical protein
MQTLLTLVVVVTIHSTPSQIKLKRLGGRVFNGFRGLRLPKEVAIFGESEGELRSISDPISSLKPGPPAYGREHPSVSQLDARQQRHVY